MSGMILDCRIALRALRRSRVMGLVAITCLALGIGPNVAMFSVVKAVLIQRLPFPNPERLVSLWVGYGNTTLTTRFFLSPEQFIEIRDRNTVLEDVAAFWPTNVSLDDGEYPVELTGARVTPALFDIIGARPVLGRTFTTEDEYAGSAVAVISEDMWNQLFARRPDILGARVVFDGKSYQIVGVLPDVARVPAGTEAWIPLDVDRIEGADRVGGSLTAIGILASGVHLTAAQTHLDAVARDVARDLPERNTNLSIGIGLWQQTLVEDVKPALMFLTAAVFGVLVLAVSNVASLVLVRARTEWRNHALRAALGASPSRLFRYIAIENTLLALAGSLLGISLAYVGVPVLLVFQPETLSPFRQITVDSRALIFAVALAFAIALVITGFIYWLEGRTIPGRRLAEGNPRSGLSRNGLLTQQALVASQIAASVVLLVGSAVLLEGFLEMRRVDPGFTPDGVLVVRIGMPPARSGTHEDRVTYLHEVLREIRGLPGVTAAGAAHVLPLTDIRWGIGFNVEGQPPATRTARHVAVWRLVSAGYHEAMDIAVLRGRTFDDGDRFTASPVVVVSESLAAQYWPGEDAIGKRLKRGTYDDPDEPWRTVIGVIRDVRDSALAGRPRAAIHFPFDQFVGRTASRMQLVVRVTGDPAVHAGTVESVIRSIDSAALIQEIAPFVNLLDETLARERFSSILVSLFAIFGLVLAAIGIYGIVSYSAAQRRTEFGIRMALGAEAKDVRSLLLRAGVLLSVSGTIAGLGIAYVLSPILETVVASSNGRSLLAYAGSALVLTVTTFLAAWVPVRRATRVDPLVALKSY